MPSEARLGMQVKWSASFTKMGPTRFELVTSSLSGTRSNQLSYEPANCGFIRPAAVAVWDGEELYERMAGCQLSPFQLLQHFKTAFSRQRPKTHETAGEDGWATK